MGAQQGSGEPRPPSRASPFLRATLHLRQQEPSLNGAFPFLLLGFLIFPKPFSIKPKTFLFLSLKPRPVLTAALCWVFWPRRSPWCPCLFAPLLHDSCFLSLCTSLTVLCNCSVLIFTMRELRLPSWPSQLPAPIRGICPSGSLVPRGLCLVPAAGPPVAPCG